MLFLKECFRKSQKLQANLIKYLIEKHEKETKTEIEILVSVRKTISEDYSDDFDFVFSGIFLEKIFVHLFPNEGIEFN